MKLRTNLKLGYIGPLTRSLDQILEKPFIHSQGLKVIPIFIKLFQNVYGSLPKTSSTLNIRTPKIIAKNVFKMFPKI